MRYKEKGKKIPRNLKRCKCVAIYIHIYWPRSLLYVWLFEYTKERNVSNVVTKKHDLGKFQEGKFQISRNTPRWIEINYFEMKLVIYLLCLSIINNIIYFFFFCATFHQMGYIVLIFRVFCSIPITYIGSSLGRKRIKQTVTHF